MAVVDSWLLYSTTCGCSATKNPKEFFVELACQLIDNEIDDKLKEFLGVSDNSDDQ